MAFEIDLSGRNALVTGGARGLGAAIARALANSGAGIVVADVDLETAGAVADELRSAGSTAIAVEMDVTRDESVSRAFTDAITRLEHVDILVNNAGVTGAPGWIDATEDRSEDWDACVQVNLLGAMRCCKAAAAHMEPRTRGSIVNISSMSGRPTPESAADAAATRPSHIPYAVTKAALLRYTQKLAPLLAPHSINVNTVCPGSLVTDFGLDIARRESSRSGVSVTADELITTRTRMAAASNLFGRPLEPSDVAGAVVFLCSDRARNITGAALHVDGGAVMW
jgi:NAD(P)-dependent dehydrogenase (short-subunit alcohol dehydrogenase family)